MATCCLPLPFPCQKPTPRLLLLTQYSRSIATEQAIAGLSAIGARCTEARREAEKRTHHHHHFSPARQKELSLPSSTRARPAPAHCALPRVCRHAAHAAGRVADEPGRGCNGACLLPQLCTRDLCARACQWRNSNAHAHITSPLPQTPTLNTTATRRARPDAPRRPRAVAVSGAARARPLPVSLVAPAPFRRRCCWRRQKGQGRGRRCGRQEEG